MAHLTKIEILKSNWDKSNSNLVVVGVYDDKTLTPIAKSINEYNKNLFDEAIKIGDVKGKKGETHLFYIENRRVLLLGLGSKEKFDTNEVRLVAGNASRFAIDKKIDNFSIECFSEKRFTAKHLERDWYWVVTSFLIIKRKKMIKNVF